MEEKFEFKPYDKVLARDHNHQAWRCDFFSHLVETGLAKYVCVGSYYKQCIPYEGNEHLLGTTDPYVEPYEPKEGDFVIIGTKGISDILWIAILKSLDKDRDEVTTYASVKDEEWDCLSWEIENLCDAKDVISIRPATEEEKQLLLSKLHDNGKDWNAEKKEIVDFKWMPEEGQEYFYPRFYDIVFKPYSAQWDSLNDWFDKIHYNKGWLFGTKEECQTLCDKLNAAIADVNC